MLQEQFKEFADSHEKGLCVIEAPTSIGKTYETFDFIARCAMEGSGGCRGRRRDGGFRQIVYLTPLKKNLQTSVSDGRLRGLREAYARYGRLHRYDDEVLFLDSITGILKSNVAFFDSTEIPDSVRSLNCFSDLKRSADTISRLDDSSGMDRELKDLVAFRATSCYQSFRKAVTKTLQPQKKDPGRTLRLEEIAESEPGNSWLYRLFPDLLIPRMKVLLMTFDKFLIGKQYASPSCSFLTPDFMKGKIIFIDEFDSTKEDIKKWISNTRSSERVDHFRLLRKIYSRAKDMILPEPFKTIDSRLAKSHHDLASFCQQAKPRMDEYRMRYSYITSDNMRDRNDTFIFADSSTHTISKTESGVHVVASPSDATGKVTLALRKEAGRKGFYLSWCNQWVIGMLKAFSLHVLQVAAEYAVQENRRRSAGNEPLLSDDDAFHTYLYKFFISDLHPGIDTADEHFLRTLAFGADMSRSLKRRYVPYRPYSYYLDGFSYCSLEDAECHNDDTVIQITAVTDTAESIMARMCNSALVFGMSATAVIPSVTSNYNMEWLKRNVCSYSELMDVYPDLADGVRQRLARRYLPYRDGRVNIDVRVIPNGREEQQDEYLSGPERGRPCPALSQFSAPGAERLARSLKASFGIASGSDDSYSLLRYYNIASVMLDFARSSGMQSLLYLGSRKVTDDKPQFCTACIRKIVEVVNSEIGADDDSRIGVEFIYSEDFEKKLGDIRRKLSGAGGRRPERLMIFSTYRSVATGQNLQYSTPERYARFLVPLEGLRTASEALEEKDIDGIYLGDITNLVQNYRTRPNAQELVSGIFQAEELCCNYEISPDVRDRSIRDLFVVHSGGQCFRNELRGCDSIRSGMTGTVIQALGRIGRTDSRNREIRMYIDRSVLEGLDIGTLDCRFKTPEVERLLSMAKGCGAAHDSATVRALNMAACRSDCAAEDINSQRISFNHIGRWTREGMEWWNNLRESVLRMPTATSGQFETEPLVRLYYISNPGMKTGSYLFSFNGSSYSSQRVCFSHLKKDFLNLPEQYAPYGGKKKPVICEMSETNARLQDALRYPGVRDWWVAQGYSEHIVADDWIMCPFLYTEIYKGAIGETVGRYIFERETGLHLDVIEDGSRFEKADFVIRERPDEYVDFKHYSAATHKSNTEQLEHVRQKMDALGASRMYIMNLLKSKSPDQYEPSCTYLDGRVVVIPWMEDRNGKANDDIKLKLLKL